MRFAAQGLVDNTRGNGIPHVIDEIPRWHNPRTGKIEPINPPESGWKTMEDRVPSMRLAGGFNLFNPFSWHKTREVRDAVQSGDPNITFSNSPTGSYLKRINEQQRMLREMGH